MEKAWDKMENEVWKSVIGYEGFYEVSNYGRVRSLDRRTASRPTYGRILSTRVKTKYKYDKVSLYGKGKPKTIAIHSLVAIHFIDKPDNELDYEVNHIDGNMYNNHYSNLEWVTHYDNMQHKNKLGTVLLGEKHQNTKFSESLVRKIKLLIKEGYTNKEIYTSIDMENMPNDYISQIRRETVWKHIQV